MIGVKYCGPALDYSGYGEANRHDIAALDSAGIAVTTEIPRYTPEMADFGDLGELALNKQDAKTDYLFKILHTTPNVYGLHIEPDKYNIGRVFWETSKLPADFVDGLKHVDEIWTGSEYNRQSLINSGVDKPIYIIPEAIQTPAPDVEPYLVAQKPSYKFYSIFEWTERKNPEALLTAYWTEFNKKDNVSLTIKTYVDNFEPRKRQEIKQHVIRLKRRLDLPYYPPIFFYFNLMNREQIYRFHETFDCFVSTHRGEGWGIPQMEALLCGNPVISTNCGGIHDWDVKSMFKIDYKMVPLEANTRNAHWYTSDQMWADVDVKHFKKIMRWLYDHQDFRADPNEIIDKFSIKSVGAMMRVRLEQILNESR